METPIQVLIVDDHEIVREGLMTLLGEEPSIEVVGQATNGLEALTQVKNKQPDVVLMDVVMPEMNGIEATQRIRHINHSTQVIILTSFSDDQQAHEAIEAGAIGYLMKDVLKSELLRAIQLAAKGKPTLHPDVQQYLMQQVVTAPPTSKFDHLTNREQDVLRLVAKGHSNKEISIALHLTEGTVKGYVSAILAKLEVADRTQAALYAIKHGLSEFDEAT